MTMRGVCIFNSLAAALNQGDLLFSHISRFSIGLRNGSSVFFPLFVTASKRIELQKPEWTTFEILKFYANEWSL